MPHSKYHVNPVRSRVWIEINLHRLRANFHALSKKVDPAGVMVVLKANAYGLGLFPIARAFQKTKVDSFGVADLNEALQLRNIGVPVQILGGILKEEVPEIVKHNIIAPIGNIETAKWLNEEALKQEKNVECHFLIDTGMARFGILPENAEEIILETTKLKRLRCNGIFSHFPHAYADAEFSNQQIYRFIALLESLKRMRVSFKKIHIANSDGINNIPASFVAPFNLVRTGLNLYGIFDSKGRKSLKLKNTLTLKSRLVAIRELKKDTTLGYGRTYKLNKDTLVGTLSIGYADGLPLDFSNVGSVFLRNQKCPILGRISMDYTTVSLEKVPEAKIGDHVTCLGDEISIGEWAALKKSIPYEIICSLGSRVNRLYIE